MLAPVVANIILQIILISALNIVVYFSYTTYVEETIVQSESSKVVVDLTKDLKYVLTPEQMDSLRDAITPVLVPPDYSKEDAEVRESNRKLEVETTKVMSVLILVGLIAVVAMSIQFNFKIRNFFVHNFIILLAVASVEFIFLTFFVKNYITLDSNFVKNRIIQCLINSGD